ncbi:Conserved oligomeric Golgi complex subunit 5 [Colletotrichum orbiculare MAFF 240422]|uniref:Conserved oligomeric Golgi complex subunit 5 n=1 Tax=Colletotrichum orbiculare (strain 104-T / ATCC 96160 / CBS 514.97 / LARS 414 / MAFF 240422) TaxID=1213857 RepID=A0A484FDS8_COLOR|nr:Conserved oligomeric Golgi complex subunit 5 [Colletotrichum orbiculare MAFF 240422]
MTTPEEEEPSYIDYEAFLSPDFNPALFANTLVLATNNPNDAPLDLSTPLSRVLFDTQEIDSHIDLLTTKSAIPLIQYTQEQTASSKRIISELDAQIKSLNDSYRQLEKEVIVKHAEAEEVRQVAIRLWETLKLGRSVGRCLQLGRQLEVQHAEIAGGNISAAAATAGKKEDHRALVRCSHTILSLREVLNHTAPGEEGHGLNKVDAIRALVDNVITPIERSVRDTAEKIVRDFAIPSMATFSQGEETKARTVSGMVTLFLLSPVPTGKTDKWAPQLLLQSLETYLRSALQSSIASLSRSLGQLPSLDRTLAEISARCQNIVALELVLESTKLPAHPLVSTPQKQTNMLQPLLAHLETGSLPSYFWRTMAGNLGTRVQEIVNRGGVSARTLRSNRASVGEAVRECVVKGCQMPSAFKGKGRPDNNWEREVAVMVGSVVNNLAR